MSIKTFTVGENGFSPYYKVRAYKEGVSIAALNNDKTVALTALFQYKDDIKTWLEEQTTSFYADTMFQWIINTEEYQA